MPTPTATATPPPTSPVPRRADARPAPIGWLLAGWIALASGPAHGLDRDAGAKSPTFTRDVAPILQARCQSCHRKDQVGPFPLETFDQARKRAHDIASVVEDRRMPPWKPAAGVGPKLKHDRSLPAAEVATLRAWEAAGAPRGDERHMPPPRVFAEGWALGTPDLVLEMAEEFVVPASGADIYRCFVIPSGLPRDVYVSAIEYRPGNARVVHHAMAFVETAGAARKKDLAEPGPGYSSYSGPGVEIVGDLGGWAAGNEGTHLPEGVGRSVPKGADVILQVHYHPTGKPEADRTRIGLHFSRGPVRQTLQWVGVASTDFRLPAGRSDVEVKARWAVPVDVDALAVTPHMHQLGRDMLIRVVPPSGKVVDLIRVPDWDPDWQGTYHFDRPVRLARGSIVEVVARYDNSPHERNPNSPPKVVKFGHEATDEMCVGYLGVVKANQDLTVGGQKDDLFAILVDQNRRNQARDQQIKLTRGRKF